MGIDIGQDDEIKKLKGRIAALESKLNGGNGMSEMLKSIKGHKVELDYGIREGILADFDDTWIKLEETDKKGNSKITLIKIHEIDHINVID